MIIGAAEIRLHLSWANSLKEKRQEARRLIERLRSKFNVSVAEVNDQDQYRYLSLGVACVSNSSSHANSILDNVIDFIEANTEAELIEAKLELL